MAPRMGIMEGYFRSEENKMKTIFYIFLSLFVMKLVWNIGVPIDLFLRLRRGRIAKNNGVSLMPFVEITFLSILFILSIFIKFNHVFFHPKNVIFVGGGSVIFSYALIFSIGCFLHDKK